MLVGFTSIRIANASFSGKKLIFCFGRAPAGRAIRCKSSLCSGLSATIPHAPASAALCFVLMLLLSP